MAKNILESGRTIHYNPWTTAEDFGDEKRQVVTKAILAKEPKPATNSNGEVTLFFNRFTSAEDSYTPKEVVERHNDRRPHSNGKTTLPVGAEQVVVKTNDAPVKK